MHFSILFQGYTIPFAMVHRWEWLQKLSPYLLPTAQIFLLSHALHSMNTLYCRMCEKRKGGCCTYHMFAQFQSQQRSSSISRVPRHCDNKQRVTACLTETGISIHAVSTESLSSTVQISHTIGSCSHFSSVSLKRLFLVSPALRPAPTHGMGSPKQVTKLPG